MRDMLFVIFGVIPVVVLGFLAVVPLLGGFAMLLSEPAGGALMIAWATAGLAGARTILRIWSDVYTDNTTLGLLAGIAAAAPLSVPSLIAFSLPGSLFLLYFTASPVIVAALVLARRFAMEEA